MRHVKMILLLERKVSLVDGWKHDWSYRELKENMLVSLGCISNILKRKHEYVKDYECNHCNNWKPKMKNDLNRTINGSAYEWFVAQ